jgi:hypothetical protein
MEVVLEINNGHEVTRIWRNRVWNTCIAMNTALRAVLLRAQKRT